MARFHNKTFLLCFSFIFAFTLFSYTLRLEVELMRPMLNTLVKLPRRTQQFLRNLSNFLYGTDVEIEQEELVQQRLKAVLNRSSVGKLIEPGSPLPVYEELYFNDLHLPRALRLPKFKENIYLLGNFSLFLIKHNISFIMSQGTLLGSYFFHSLIPWDDDLDIFVNIQDINKLRALFRQSDFRKTFGISSFHDPADPYDEQTLKEDIPLSNTTNCGTPDEGRHICYQMVKVYYHNSPHAGDQIWRYPFIDIFFTHIQNNYVINHEDHKIIKTISVPVVDFYPLVLRPLHNLWLPAPHDTKAFLKVDYWRFVCQNGWLNHQHERANIRIRTTSCDFLKLRYPYIRRRPVKDNFTGEIVRGKVYEDVIFRGIVLHSVMVMQNYTTEDLMKLEYR